MGVFHEVISRHEPGSTAAHEEALTVLAHLFCRIPMPSGYAHHLKERASHQGQCVVILPELPEHARAVVHAYQAEVRVV